MRTEQKTRLTYILRASGVTAPGTVPTLALDAGDQVSRLKSVTSLGGFELESLVEEADCVVATVRDQNGHSHSVRAQYLIGADACCPIQ